MMKTNTDVKRSMTQKVLTRKLWVLVRMTMTGKVLTRKLWVLVIAALLIVGPLPWPVAPVLGANFTVNTTADTTDTNLGDGTCADSMGQCSLRAAIQEANALAGADTISLQSGATYTLSLDTAGGDENSTAQEDDLDVRSQITIEGNGATIQRSSMDCDLDGDQEIGEFRIFQVLSGGNLTLQNVTVTNGCADGMESPDPNGGGILVASGGTLTVTSSTISQNSANIVGGGIRNSGTVTLTNSTISENTAGNAGGGISNDSTGMVTITNSMISDNTTLSARGGGINNDGTVAITGSTISGNSARDDGGGIRNSGTATITGSTISGNSTGDDGGGIRNSGKATITNSTISNNSASESGGGIANGGTMTITASTISNNSTDNNVGGGIYNAGTVNVLSSTISGNTAESNSGGGIFNDDGGDVTITNSTISGNTAANAGGGIFNQDEGEVEITASTISGNTVTNGIGGGIVNGGILTLTNSTISGNTVNDGDGGGILNSGTGTVNASFVTIANNSAGAAGKGGGIFNDMSGTVNIKNSIVGNNAAPTGPNCSGALTPTGANLATDGSCTGFNPPVPSTGAGGLNLGPLQVNAPGTTATHALQSGSAAIDAVSDCTDFLTQLVTADQRGVNRPLNGDGTGMALCDVGAYEAPAQSPPPPPPSSQVLTLQGNGVCLTLNLQTRQYIFKDGRRTIAGIFTYRQTGQTIRFQSAYGDTNRLSGSINLSTRTVSATLTLPVSLGGRRYSFTTLASAPCP